MKLNNYTAIVLRRARHLEDDGRLTLFLREEGKVIVTVKGAQKLHSKLNALQEPFIKADLQLFLPQHGVYGRIIQGRLLDSRQGLRSRLSGFQIASQACEVVDLLFPYRAQAPDAFDLLDGALHEFETAPDPNISWLHFVLELLKILGHGEAPPEILECLASSAKGRCLAYVDAELQRILPQQLKTDAFKLQF